MAKKFQPHGQEGDLSEATQPRLLSGQDPLLYGPPPLHKARGAPVHVRAADGSGFPSK